MKNTGRIFLIIILILLPVIYIIFYDKIKNLWGFADGLITVILYIIGIFSLLYTIDIKTYFFIQKILMFFRYDYTNWLFSVNYITQYTSQEIIEKLNNYFLKTEIIIKSLDQNRMEILWNNKFLINIRIENSDENNIVYVYTSKIVVPSKQNSTQIRELSKILEGIEKDIQSEGNLKKTYEIDIEYIKTSPYYGYWVRKLPEQSVYDFNCKLKIADAKGEIVKVNKNHIIIRAFQFTTLFDLTKKYVSLQSAG